MLDDFQASFKVILDDSEIGRQISDLQKNIDKTSTLKLKVELADDSLDIKGLNNLLSKNFSNAGANAGQSFSKSLSSSLNKIHLVNGGIGNVKNILQGAGFDKKSINSITQDLNKMILTVNKINTNQLRNGNIRMKISGVDELGRAVNIVRTFDKETGNVINTTKSFTQSFSSTLKGISDSAKNTLSNIQLKINTGDFKTKIDSVKTSLNSLANGSESAKKNIALLEAAFDTMNSSTATPKEKIQAYRDFNSILSTTRTQLSEAEKAERKFAQSTKEAKRETETLTKSNTLSSNIQAWMQQNVKAAERYGDVLRELQQQLNNNSDPVTFRSASLRFSEIKSEAKAAGLVVNTFNQSLKDTVKQLLNIGSTVAVIQQVIRVLRQMYEAVYDIDTAMTELYKVTDESTSRYAQYLNNAKKSAQELGRSVSSYINQTASWAKLGFNIDEAEELSKISSIYANVGDIEDETAVSDMVTAMKAFNIEASNSITIVDALNELGNNFATSAGDLGQGLTKSASALHAAGTDIKETLAMLTGGTEITQNATEFGQFLKTSSMRIRGMKGELEALGEEVDDNIDSISKVQTQILNLTHGKVNIFDDAGNFRDYYDIMKEISSIYDDLQATERASLDEILFGKRGANQGAALISAFQSGQIEKAYQTAVNSAGSAYKEQERWMESLQAKTAQLEAAWQSLSETILNSDFLKGLIDSGTIALNVLDNITSTIGTLNTLLIGFTTFKGIKSIS